jgi:2'-5' RNA ligase
MTHIKLFESWLKLNEDKGKHSHGCAMLMLKFPLDEVQSQIDDEDLYLGGEDDDRSFGKEDDPHVTLLYGLNDDETSEDEVFDACIDIEYPEVRLHNVSCFKNDKYDVLKFDADCDELHSANKSLSKLPHTSSFPDYHPHATIAYLKSGMGDKYIEKFKDLEYMAEPTVVEYSKAEGDKIEKPAKRYIEKQEN